MTINVIVRYQEENDEFRLFSLLCIDEEESSVNERDWELMRSRVNGWFYLILRIFIQSGGKDFKMSRHDNRGPASPALS